MNEKQLIDLGQKFVDDFKENEKLFNLMKQQYRQMKDKIPCCHIPYTKIVNGVQIRYSFAALYFTLLENIENGNIDLNKLTVNDNV